MLWIFYYLPVIVPVIVLLILLFTMKEKTGGVQQAAYRYFTCTGCQKKLRVPFGKGRIRVKCPNCGKEFEMRT